MDIEVGDTFYLFDINRRVYKLKDDGSLFNSGGPIYREHFYPVQIEGETSRSWVLPHGKKVPKKAPFSVLYTEKMVDESCWLKSNRHKLASMVNGCRDFEILKQIGDLLGFEEDK